MTGWHPAGGPAGRRGHAGQLRHLARRRSRSRSRGRRRNCRDSPGVRVAPAGPNGAAVRGDRQHRAADHGAGRAPGRDAVSREPSLEEVFLHHYDRRDGSRASQLRSPRRADAVRSARAAVPLADAARRAGSHVDVRRTCSRCTPTSSRSATATRTRPPPSACRSRAAFATNKALRSCSTASRTTCSRSAATARGGSAGPGDRSPRCSGCWPRSARMRDRRGLRTRGAGAGRDRLPPRPPTWRAGRDRRDRRGPVGRESLAGSHVGGLPAGGSAYLALARLGDPRVRGRRRRGSQLAPTHRTALELGAAVVALASLLRVVADTANGAGWLQWLTPLGWAERAASVHRSGPVVLLLPWSARVC